MIAEICVAKELKIRVNLNKPICISVPIKEGDENPNCYWAEPVKFETIKSGNFIGSVREGGPVNYQKLQITPHGNGTHIEGYGHITSSGATINKQLQSFHFYCKLITVTPTKVANGDLVIKLTNELKTLDYTHIKAIALRTLPNNSNKLTKNYSGNNPPYVDYELIRFFVTKGIDHLLIDLPSIDREEDNGALLAHNEFWGTPDNLRENCTITELIFVDANVSDDNYLLNFQMINLEMDAAPCNPTLYKIIKT